MPVVVKIKIRVLPGIKMLFIENLALNTNCREKYKFKVKFIVKSIKNI